MNEAAVIGDYRDIESQEGTLRLSIQLPIGEIMEHWSRCGLLANFGASYLAVGCATRKNIANSLSFIINELLENAAKYSQPKEGRISIALLEKDSAITIEIQNSILPSQIEGLDELARRMIDQDYVNTRYIEMMIANASAKSPTKSGIGLLTIVSYFKADMSFRIAGTEGGGSLFSVQVNIDAEEL